MHFVVVRVAADHFVTMFLEQLCFLAENFVFAAWLLIRIVNGKDLHETTRAKSSLF